MKHTELLVILGVLSSATPVLADPSEDEEVYVQPFGADPKFTFDFANRGVALQGKSGIPLTLKGKTDVMLRDWGLSPRIVARQKSAVGFNLASDRRIQSLEYGFSVDGFPLCQYQIKSHETLDGKLAVLGRMPKIAVDQRFDLSDWPADDLVRNTVADALAENGISTQFTKNSGEACLWADGGSLHPVWVWEVEVDKLNYTVVADESRSYKFQAKHFHADGKATIYPSNVLDAATQVFPLRDMKTTGYLENKYFVTVVESPFDYAQVMSLDFTFDPSSQTSSFEEVSLFTNANRALEWLESVGYSNFGTIPIRIAVHADFQGDSNNALYQPGSNYDVIYVGDGDGTVLQNLATDSDVVGHELGHHVVYHTVTEIAGESLVIHEGLADYFNFARTGNACLGESICPDTAYGNKICYVPKKCLRTAENTLKYGASDLPREAHQRSQFISGLLWDLYSKDGIELNDVTHMVLKSIDLLVKDSGYKHLIVGMLLADHALFQGKNCSVILNRANERGLSTFLSDISCATVALTPDPKNVEDLTGPGSGGTAVIPATTSSKSSKKSVCGVLGASAAEGQVWSFIVLFVLPLAPAFIRRTRRKD